MSQRIDHGRVAPGVRRALLGLDQYVAASGLDPRLAEIVRVRVSQMNGCAFCIDRHTGRARALGETEQRLYALDAWRDGPYFSEPERAALAWAEAVTRLGPEGVSDEVYRAARVHFGEKALVDLTLVVAAINAWNRLSIAMRTTPGGATTRESVASAAGART